MNVDRLLTLADRLDEVDPEHFNMNKWSSGEKPCQTAGCALGYATTIDEFAAEGLTLVCRKPRRSELSDYWFPVYNGYKEFRAAEVFFDLTPRQAFELFSPEKYSLGNRRDPSIVAARIRTLVEETT